MFPLTNMDGTFQRCLSAAAVSTPFDPRARFMSMMATSILPSTPSAMAKCLGHIGSLADHGVSSVQQHVLEVEGQEHLVFDDHNPQSFHRSVPSKANMKR